VATTSSDFCDEMSSTETTYSLDGKLESPSETETSQTRRDRVVEIRNPEELLPYRMPVDERVPASLCCLLM
jgi:hypothetical protein